MEVPPPPSDTHTHTSYRSHATATSDMTSTGKAQVEASGIIETDLDEVDVVLGAKSLDKLAVRGLGAARGQHAEVSLTPEVESRVGGESQVWQGGGGARHGPRKE